MLLKALLKGVCSVATLSGIVADPDFPPQIDGRMESWTKAVHLLSHGLDDRMRVPDA